MQNKSQATDDVINYVNMLSADFLFLKAALDDNVPFVTKGQQQRLKELDAAWDKHKETMKSIIDKDVASFNDLCDEANIKTIILPESK